MTIIITAAYVIFLPILWVSVIRLIWERRRLPKADEVHFAHTSDGYRLALHRYRPERIRKGREPVILCHGLGANHYSLDPAHYPSIAKYLAGEGFDVYALDLRGRGLSSRPGAKWGRPLDWGWSFDDYVAKDLPAAIKYVRNLTGAESVNWIGHSMGGMAAYAYLQEHLDGGGMKSATAIAGPGVFEKGTIWAPVMKAGPLLLKPKRIPSRDAARLAAPLAWLLPARRFGMSMWFFPWLAVNCVENISSPVLAQFHQWVRDKTFCNKDGSKVYCNGLGEIKAPMLTMVGKGDLIANPGNMKRVAEMMPEPRHKHVYFSKKGGAMENYDHLSIVMGKNAPREVYPVIADWLRKHSAK